MPSLISIQVVAGKNLAPKDSNGLSDPYACVWCLPEETKCKTKILYKTLNPEWREAFEFEVDESNPSSEIRVEIWDHDKFAADDFMGLVILPVHKFIGKEVVDEWHPLKSRYNKKDIVSGEVRLIVKLKMTSNANSSYSSFQTIKEREKRFIDIVSEDMLKSLSSVERKRQEIMFECINTEAQFVDDVKIMINSFLNPTKEKQLLSSLEVYSIFSNVEAILPISEAFLQDLQKRQSQNPVISLIADIFLKHVDKFEIYTTYCSNQSSASESVEQYREKYQNFSNFLDENKPECRNLSLQGFLVKPLQRLCKYPLLIRELVNSTPSDHPDYANLTLSLSKFKAIVDSANERTRHFEQLRKLNIIRELFEKSDCLEIFQYGRKYIFDTRTNYMKDIRDKPIEVLTILFNDLIFIARQRRETLSTLKKIPLREVNIRDVPDTPDTQNALEFRILEDVFTLEMNSSEEKKTWVNKLTDLKDILLHDELMQRSEKLKKLDAHRFSEMKVNANNVEDFDYKVKIAELQEILNRERTLRILSEKTLEDSKHTISELSFTNSYLENQITLHSLSGPALPSTPKSSGGSKKIKKILPTFGKSTSQTKTSTPPRAHVSDLKDSLQMASNIKQQYSSNNNSPSTSFQRGNFAGSQRSAHQASTLTSSAANAAASLLKPEDKTRHRRSRSFDFNEEKLEELQKQLTSSSHLQPPSLNSSVSSPAIEKKTKKEPITLEEKLKKSQKKLKRSQARVDSLEASCKRLNDENALLHDCVQKQEPIRSMLRDQITALGRENKRLEEKVQELQKTLEGGGDNIVKSLMEKNTSLEAQLKEQQSLAVHLQNLYEEVLPKKTESERQLELALTEIENAKKFRNESDDFKQTIWDLRLENSKFSLELSNLQSKFSNDQEEILKLQSQNANLQFQLSELKSQLSSSPSSSSPKPASTPTSSPSPSPVQSTPTPTPVPSTPTLTPTPVQSTPTPTVTPTAKPTIAPSSFMRPATPTITVVPSPSPSPSPSPTLTKKVPEIAINPDIKATQDSLSPKPAPQKQVSVGKLNSNVFMNNNNNNNNNSNNKLSLKSKESTVVASDASKPALDVKLKATEIVQKTVSTNSTPTEEELIKLNLQSRIKFFEQIKKTP